MAIDYRDELSAQPYTAAAVANLLRVARRLLVQLDEYQRDGLDVPGEVEALRRAVEEIERGASLCAE